MYNVLLTDISIENFKNVESSIIQITKIPVSLGDTSTIKGIYGQNGSGKTTVIQALDIFKNIVLRKPLREDMFFYILAGKKSCTLSFSFYIAQDDDKTKYKINYSVSIEKDESGKCHFSNETLKRSRYIENEGWNNFLPVFKCTFDDPIKVFEPKNKYESLIKANKENIVNLSVAYKLAKEKNISLLFSKDLSNILKDSEDSELYTLVSIITKYTKHKLFIIQNSHNGIISLDVMPLAVLYHFDDNRTLTGEILITLTEPMVTTKEQYEVVSNLITNMDKVMGALVPGLSVFIKSHGPQALQDGTEGMRYELMSKRGESEFPIRYESEGIKKILSVLSIIIAMYNDPSICVAIDELDAGIFEILLGSLLQIIQESGKGQLIFTSHNLRPLEVLNDENIIFTTTNPKNRYINLKGIREDNNLRDTYIRALKLGGQDESLSTEFKESHIRIALRKAGKHGN